MLLYKTDCVEPFDAAIWTFSQLVPTKVPYMEKNPGMFSSKTYVSLQLKKERREHLGWHGVSKLSRNSDSGVSLKTIKYFVHCEHCDILMLMPFYKLFFGTDTLCLNIWYAIWYAIKSLLWVIALVCQSYQTKCFLCKSSLRLFLMSDSIAAIKTER